jgi:hypothetical protein
VISIPEILVDNKAALDYLGCMANQLQDKLASLRWHSTRYELVATHPDGRKVLVGYTPRRGRSGLFDMLATNGVAWVKFANAENITFGKRVADGAISGDWSINFSGRTQRDAICSGELPFFPREVTNAA